MATDLKSKYYIHTSHGGVNECIEIDGYFQGVYYPTV